MLVFSGLPYRPLHRPRGAAGVTTKPVQDSPLQAPFEPLSTPGAHRRGGFREVMLTPQV